MRIFNQCKPQTSFGAVSQGCSLMVFSPEGIWVEEGFTVIAEEVSAQNAAPSGPPTLVSTEVWPVLSASFELCADVHSASGCEGSYTLQPSHPNLRPSLWLPHLLSRMGFLFHSPWKSEWHSRDCLQLSLQPNFSLLLCLLAMALHWGHWQSLKILPRGCQGQLWLSLNSPETSRFLHSVTLVRLLNFPCLYFLGCKTEMKIVPKSSCHSEEQT